MTAHTTFTDYQHEIGLWMKECFGNEITYDRAERNHRFLEEALELVQSGGITREEAYLLVDYVFSRPVGDFKQEVGGTIVTLMALCNAYHWPLAPLANKELARIWGKVDTIREKQKTKPKSSALPTDVVLAQGSWVVKSDGGKKFRIEDPHGQWVMQPEGNITATQAQAICTLAAWSASARSEEVTVPPVKEPEMPQVRRDANGDPIPWGEEHDYFMALDPENPDLPMD